MGKAQRRKQERVSAPRVEVAAQHSAFAGTAALDGAARALLAPLLIATTVLVLYANSFAIPFQFDDYFEIVKNPLVKVIEPPLEYLRRSRGISGLTFALNYSWRGFDVWGFHLVNVLVHAANGLLVYALVLHTLRRPGLRERYGDAAAALAALVALVFVAHPLQTMATSYIVQRTEAIGAFFYLLTMLLFALATSSLVRARRMLLYAGAVLSAFLGVVSKEVVATVPAAALAYRLCFPAAARSGGRVTRVLAAALLLAPLAYALVLAWPALVPVNQNADPDAPRAWLYIPTAGFGLTGITPRTYLLTQFGVIVWYLRLFILPTHQSFDYGWPFANSFWRADVILPLIVLLALLAAAIWAYRRYALATFCLLWVFITLAPTSSFIPLRDAAFEHRMYLPIVGLAWLVVVGGWDLLGWVAERRQASAARLRRAAAGVAAVWIALLGMATIARNSVMQDPIALWADTAAKSPRNWRAHSSYAESLLEVGRNDEAMRALEESVRLNPEIGSSRVELGQLYLRAGRLDEAEAVLLPATDQLEESVAAAAYQQLASLYERRGETAKAVDMLRAAVDRKPGWATLHVQLAQNYARAGFWYGAAGHYNTAIDLNSRLIGSVGAAAVTANVRAAQNQLDEGNPDMAEHLLQEALRYQPSDLPARHYLAVVYARRDDWDRAQGQLEALRQTLPDDPLLRDNLQRAHDHQQLIQPPLP